MCTGLKGSQDSHKLHMQSTSFATRSAFFMRLNLLPRQGGWCHLRCSWTAGIGLSCHYRWAQVSHRSCVTSPSLNSPLKWLKTSPMGRRQPCMDKWVSPHPSSHKSHVPLSQSVSEGVPRPWGALLSRYPLKSGSYHLRKKIIKPTKALLRHRWISCILSLVLNLFPFFFLTSVEKWASNPPLTWLSQIHLYPDCQAEINQEFFLFPSFLHLFPTWTFHSSTCIRTMAIFFYSLTAWEWGV